MRGLSLALMVGSLSMALGSCVTARPDAASSVIGYLGLGTNLEFCLDAADINSYSGSGQTWTDLSGNGYNFLRGTTSGAEATDPTFNGTAGDLRSGTYWSLDGGDRFTLGQSNPAWVNNLHKNNAAFTLMFWIYAKTTGAITTQELFTTRTNPVTETGFAIYFGYDAAEGTINVQVTNAGSNAYLQGTIAEAVTVNDSAWNFVALSLDESVGVGGTLFQVNADGFVDNASSTYSSPSAGSASQTATLGADVTPNYPMRNGSRYAVACAWSRALTAAEIDSFFQATRQRFGI